MRRHYSIIMIGGSYKGRRILYASLEVMYGGVRIERFKLRFVFPRTVISDPVPADREFVETQHVHHACLFHDCPKQFRALIRPGTHQQAAIRSTMDCQLTRGGVLLRDQILGRGDEVVKNVLFLELRSRFMPLLAILATAAHIRRGINDTLL